MTHLYIPNGIRENLYHRVRNRGGMRISATINLFFFFVSDMPADKYFSEDSKKFHSIN